MAQDSNTFLQGSLKQQGLYTTRPQFTNILYGTVLQTDVSIAPLLPDGASNPIPTGTMTVAVAALGTNYVTPPILYPGGVAPDPGTVVAVGFTPNGTPVCTTIYAEVGGTTSLDPIEFVVQIHPGGYSPELFYQENVPSLGPNNFDDLPNIFETTLTSIPFLVLPGGLVCSEYGVDLDGTFTESFNLLMNVVITDLTCSNSGNVYIAGTAGGGVGGLDMSTFNFAPNAGSDLYVDGDDNMRSTDGGIYMIMITASAEVS